MAKRSKKYQEAAALIEKGKAYPIDEAVALVKKTSKVNFDASVDVVFKLGLDTRHADQQLRGADRKSTRLNSSHSRASRMPSSA